MAVTLYEALNSFNEQYRTALANNSRRLIDRFDQDWQQINNDWDLYFQAKAESNELGAARAIADMVEILGGDIDTTVLPDIGGTATSEFDNVQTVVAGSQKINFIGSFPDTNYRLIINFYDLSGNQVIITRGTKEEDGFNVTPTFSGVIEYNAKYIGA